MNGIKPNGDTEAIEYSIGSWRIVLLSDLPELEEMVNNASRKVFGPFDITLMIEMNVLSLCQLNYNKEISSFVSLSNKPNIACIPTEHWTEWLQHLYNFKNVTQNNTLFIHLLLFQNFEYMAYFSLLLQTVYSQLPEISYIFLVKPPNTELCAELCLPFHTLRGKISNLESEHPEILYHSKDFIIKKMHLRIAEESDNDDLRQNLGKKLHFMDKYYGEYCLAELFRYPGNNRVNLVPIHDVNGFVTINTNLNYALIENIFDLSNFPGLLVPIRSDLIQHEETVNESGDFSYDNDKNYCNQTDAIILLNAQHDFKTKISNKFSFQKDSSLYTKKFQDHSLNQREIYKNKKSTKKENIPDCENIFYKRLENIPHFFWKYQDKELNINQNSSSRHIKSSSLINFTKETSFKNTSFIIELILINEDAENMCIRDYLVSCFDHFSQYEYCVIAIPTIAKSSGLKKYFVKVPLKPNNYFSMDFYVLHRCFMYGEFKCILANEDHISTLKSIINNHPNNSIILNNFYKAVFDKYEFKAFIFYCNDEAIGYCIIQICDVMNYLKVKYDVAKYIYPDHARNHMALILNIGLQTIFTKKTRHFLRQMMEMSDLNSLFYKVYSNNNLMEMHQITYTPIINELIPIKPRLQSHCLNNVPKDNEIFSLYHMNSQLSTVEKVSVDAKIVVVGASDVALSFLENLIFNSANYFLIFENITLLSDYGMRFKYELRDNQKLFLPNMSHYSYDLMLSLGLNNWVNVVTGKATAINRTDKYIIVNNSDHLYYDYLFLFCGEQFVCDYVHEEKGIRRPSFLSQDSRHIDYTESEVLIKNLFVLNSDTDVLRMSMCMEKLKSSRKDIVVYGKYIGSLSVINALLESDIKGSRINFVENESVENMPFIESPYIKDAVYDKLKQLDIKVYSQCTFVKWKLKDKNTRISKITFQKDNKNIRFKCSGLFWFGLRKISNITGNVLIRSSMKFDGHLVVNNSFETNDEYIFAAGPVAKFNPAYRFDDVLSHIHFSSIEIGTRVANKVGNLFGIFEDSNDNTDMVQPLFVQCQLPGKYNYLHCVTPGFKFMDINTKIIKTGNKDVGYFEMVVDQADFVRVISCYSNNEFPYLNIIKLCGKHLSLFDISKERLEKNSITCFFKYFDEPWARGIYLDKFGDLLNDLAHHRINKHYKKTANNFYENIDKLILKHNSKTVSSLPTYTELEDEFKDKFLKIIENSLLKFVENHLDELPEYAHPLTISKFVDKENMSDFWNKVLYENDCEPGLSNC